MNELSVLIYAADALGTIKIVSGVVAVAAIPAGFLVGAMQFSQWEENPHRADIARWDQAMANHVQYPSLYEKPPSDARPTLPDGVKPPTVLSALRVPIIVGSIALAVFCFSPSSKTVYAIAASEMGERVLTSDTANKAVRALDAWLDRQIGGTPEA